MTYSPRSYPRPSPTDSHADDVRTGSGRQIVIAAGGTGGHFFPAEALASELSGRGHRIALMCDARSGGLNSGAFAQGERFVISGAGIAGRGLAKGATAALSLVGGVVQARRILGARDIAAVVGFGGYPAIGPIIGARLMRRRPRLVLHEQNAVLGRANRLLARHADVLALSQQSTARVPSGARTVVTGNPVRANIAAQTYRRPTDVLELLVLGGSLGARILSDVVPAAVAAAKIRIRVVQQCRAEDIARVRDAYATSGIDAELSPFFEDVASRLAVSHLVIARAGASTVAELAVVGRPSILVPLPGAIDDHQTANARLLADAGAAWLVPQAAFTAAALAALLAEMTPERLVQAAQMAASLRQADAAKRLADVVESLIA